PALIGAVAASAIAQSPEDWKRQGWKTDFDKHTVPFDEIVSGGPPKDGIPAIDSPRFTSVDAADKWLDDRELVMVVEHAGDVHAYPIQILMWHEIVNDRIGDMPVAVTYCPLCNTAIAFDRRFDGGVLDFGTTGKLRHSDLVMYDRQTESWWQQASGEGLVGVYAGRELIFVPSRMHDWRTVRTLHPSARVLSRETGRNAPYGRNPYEEYDRSSSPWPRFFRAGKDDRLPAMERVAAVRHGEASVAYPFSELKKVRVVNDEIEGVPVVVFWAPGAASSVDARRVADGREVGSTAVFDRRAAEQTLMFEPVGDGQFSDRETGSVWSMAGMAETGPLAGERLDAIVHGDFFWFAWAVFKPDTRIWRP
ncbi:MAG: DUF3179 domain-containing protein, partial [Longimicrobiales bacterium]